MVSEHIVNRCCVIKRDVQVIPLYTYRDTHLHENIQLSTRSSSHTNEKDKILESNINNIFQLHMNVQNQYIRTFIE